MAGRALLSIERAAHLDVGGCRVKKAKTEQGRAAISRAAGKIFHGIMVSDVLILSEEAGAALLTAPACHHQALMANSVIIPVERCGMWWQCSIQRAASPASMAIVTMAIGGT